MSESTKTPEIFLISNTLYETFCSCPTKYNYSYNHKYALEGTPIYFTFGTAIHRAFEEWYRTRDVDRCLFLIEDEYRRDNNFEYEGLDVRTVGKAKDVFIAYVSKHPTEPFVVLETNNKKWLETSFAFPLGLVTYLDRTVDVVYRGRFDGLVNWGGLNLVHDIKTSSRNINFVEKYKPNNQMAGYCNVAREVSGFPIEGVVINSIVVQKTKNIFDKSLITYTKEEVDEWKNNIKQVVKTILFHEHEKVYPMHTTHCYAMGKCMYYDVCRSPEDYRMKMLEGNFVKKKGDSLEARDVVTTSD